MPRIASRSADHAPGSTARRRDDPGSSECRPSRSTGRAGRPCVRPPSGSRTMASTRRTRRPGLRSSNRRARAGQPRHRVRGGRSGGGKRRFGMDDRRRHVTAHAREASSVERDSARQVHKERRLTNDHAGGLSLRAFLVVAGGRDPSLGGHQALLHLGNLSNREARAGVDDRQGRSHLEGAVGQGIEPASERQVLSSSEQVAGCQLDEVSGPGDVVGGERVVDRCRVVALLLEPGARPPMERRRSGVAARPANGPAARRRTGGGSGTSAGDHRAR